MILGSVVLDSKDCEELGKFYQQLLQWDFHIDVTDGMKWGILNDPSKKSISLVFQEEPDYVPPVWPTQAQGQQQMLHLDFYVKEDEYQDKIAHALSCGAKRVDTQFSEKWTVFFDPAGHPFCIIPVPNETGMWEG